MAWVISFDPAKRDQALRERGLNFADAGLVFAGPVFEFEDDRFEYGETRIVTYGLLSDRLVAIVWTSIGDDRRIISMRKANDREYVKYRGRLD